jgi:hypothetical protein
MVIFYPLNKNPEGHYRRNLVNLKRIEVNEEQWKVN